MAPQPDTAAARIRAAARDEAVELTALSMRSKAYWGYDPDFIATCADELRIDASDLSDPAQIWRVALLGDRIAGLYGLAPVDAEIVELVALFVEPDDIGSGVGRLLLDDAIISARAKAFARIRIQSDPNAENFYLAVGARRTGQRESGSIPGRLLPLFEIDLAR